MFPNEIENKCLRVEKVKEKDCHHKFRALPDSLSSRTPVVFRIYAVHLPCAICGLAHYNNQHHNHETTHAA